MKIAKADVIRLRIPFSDPGSRGGLFPGKWDALDFVLLRLETDSGLVGWGEGFSYFCATSVAAILRETIAPALVGRDLSDSDAILSELRHKLHIIGRYGITMFAISATDIALNDLSAKAAGLSLAEHLGGRRRDDVPAYASMIRYGDPAMVADIAAKAVSEGFQTIKLHEIRLDCIAAGREGVGPATALTNDVNCNWTLQQTLDWADELRALSLTWLEEPTFPPEDYGQMARIREETGIPIATGENACTHYQFADMIANAATDFVQPSVTKIGGIADTMETRRLAKAAGLKIAHHAPYFGPGYLATLQVLAAAEDEELFEYLYVEREADLFGNAVLPENGRVAIPDTPGLGFDPDPAVLARFAV